MKKHIIHNLKLNTLCTLVSAILLSGSEGMTEEIQDDSIQQIEQIHLNRHNQEMLAEILPIVKCSFIPSQYEQILMTQLRDRKTSIKDFRCASQKIGTLLVNKVIEQFCIKPENIETPLTTFSGVSFQGNIELVSIMRSGDALLDTFVAHFPEANISKILIQRDEKTAKAQFKYMKLSPTIASGNLVVIPEPMLATGGTLDMVISLLKDRGVQEDNIIIACICTAPEGLLLLNKKYPSIKVVITVMDEELNEKMFIVPGLGDFGDRYFGTQ